MENKKVVSKNEHGAIIRRGVTCKKVHCYMRDSTCSCSIVEKGMIF